MERSSSANRDKEKMKHREAAFKAWKTIKRKRHEAAPKATRKLEEFITPERIGSISHPETLPRIKKKYGKGIICQFEKTPPNILCGKFWELRWAFGCPLNCAYCYLRGTNRGNMKPRYLRIRDVIDALEEAFNDSDFNGGKPALFNSGELSDSLMNPAMMAMISDKFEEQSKHKLLILTKFGTSNIRFLVEKLRKNTTCAWSINAIDVAKLWETLAPSPEERIEAASQVSSMGYEVRVRIDPIFPIEGWKEIYGYIISRILSKIQPNRIILGTPRGLWKTIFYAKKAGMDMSWAQYFDEAETGWGKKLPFSLRREIYEFMYDNLTSLGYDKKNISICKETTALLDDLGLRYAPSTCQCYSH